MTRIDIIKLGTAVLLAGGVASIARAGAMEHAVASGGYEDVYYVPPTESLRVLSLGWDEALADVLWVKALVYFGEEMSQHGALRHVFDYTDAMLALDPEFRAVYRWVATAGLYRPQAVTADDANRTIEYLRRAHQRFPEDGEIAWTLGAALAFELPSLLSDSNQREAARAEGAGFLVAAARLGAGPAWLALTNASILARVGRAEAAAAHLEEMYLMTQDETLRTQIAEGIAALRSSARSEVLVELTREEEERRLREFPYLSVSLYSLIGPRPVEDWPTTYRHGFARHVLHDRDAEMLRLISDVTE